TGIFPGRKDSLDEIENNDVIGIPKDPSNAARAYAILQKADLLKLKKDIDLVNVTQNDIIENKHNLEIQEMDSAQIPRALDDLDYGVIPGSIVYSSGLDPSLSLLDEDILERSEEHTSELKSRSIHDLSSDLDLLKLKKDIDLVNVTQNDIIENKHNLEIQEMDSAQIPRALDDLDYGVIPGSIVYSSALDPSLSLLDEDILE